MTERTNSYSVSQAKRRRNKNHQGQQEACDNANDNFPSRTNISIDSLPANAVPYPGRRHHEPNACDVSSSRAALTRFMAASFI